MYAQRGLETTYSKLKPYLFKGARVLDVGCGPGTVTLDVAEAVYPGEVFGIDPEAASIAQANQIKAERQVQNATFQTGDARMLEFGDNEFDVVYALSVFGWFPGPIKALAEMRRVAKKGGWVFATLGGEGTLAMMYPPCPAYEKVRAVRQKYWTDPEDPDHYYDAELARRSAELFGEAGLVDVHLESTPGGIYFRGQDKCDMAYDLMFLDYKSAGAEAYGKLFSLGVLDEETVVAAQNEVKAWATHPYTARLPGIGVIAAERA